MTQTRRTPPRLQPAGPVRLTGRGAVLVLFTACFVSQLFADWTGWVGVADVVFFMGCGLVAYHTRRSGLRYVVVCPPLVFFAAAVTTEMLTSSGTFSALEGLLVTMGLAAPWLFLTTAVTAVIAFVRGFRPGRLTRFWLGSGG